jgi:hypothetical protein
MSDPRRRDCHGFVALSARPSARCQSSRARGATPAAAPTSGTRTALASRRRTRRRRCGGSCEVPSSERTPRCERATSPASPKRPAPAEQRNAEIDRLLALVAAAVEEEL